MEEQFRPYIQFVSPNDVEVYIGGKRLLSVYRLEWQTVRNASPVIHYRSTRATTYALGPMLITGNLAINMSSPVLLQYVLSHLINKTDQQTMREVLQSLEAGDYQSVVQALLRVGVAPLVAVGFASVIRATSTRSVVDYGEFDLFVRYRTGPAQGWTRIFRRCRLTGEGEVLSASTAPGGDASSSGAPIILQYPFVAIDEEIVLWEKAQEEINRVGESKISSTSF